MKTQFVFIGLMSLTLNFHAWGEIIDQSDSLVKLGQGNISCRATCIMTQGAGINRGQLTGAIDIEGKGYTSEAAFAVAKSTCTAGLFSNHASLSRGVQIHLVREFTMGTREENNQRSSGLVVLDSVPAAIKNCIVQ